MKIFSHFSNFRRYNILYCGINQKYFSVSLSFKNKINSLFKYVHPDVLGNDTPEEYRKTNERSIQEFNSYLENLNQAHFFEKKTIYFFIKLEKKASKEKSENFFEKISVDLDTLKPEMTQSNKFAIQSNLGLAIEEVVKKISKIKSLNMKEKLTQKDFEDMNSQELTFINDKPKIYNHKSFIEEISTFQSTLIAYKNKTISDFEQSKLDLIKKVDRAINNKTDFFQNRRNPDIQAKFLVESLSSFNKVSKQLLNTYPLHLIYLDPKITDEQKKIFLDKFHFKNLDSVEKYNESRKLSNLTEELLDRNNTIRLYISDRYDIYDLPGYFTIPFDYTLNDALKYFYENKLELFKIKEKFIEDNNCVQEIRKEFDKIFLIRDINFTARSDKNLKALAILQQLNMALKKLRKLFIENFSEIIKKDNSANLKYKPLYKFDKLEINFYKPKTEIINEKSGKTKLNISYPINDELIVKLISNRFEFFERIGTSIDKNTKRDIAK